MSNLLTLSNNLLALIKTYFVLYTFLVMSNSPKIIGLMYHGIDHHYARRLFSCSQTICHRVLIYYAIAPFDNV